MLLWVYQCRAACQQVLLCLEHVSGALPGQDLVQENTDSPPSHFLRNTSFLVRKLNERKVCILRLYTTLQTPALVVLSGIAKIMLYCRDGERFSLYHYSTAEQICVF